MRPLQLLALVATCTLSLGSGLSQPRRLLEREPHSAVGLHNANTVDAKAAANNNKNTLAVRSSSSKTTTKKGSAEEEEEEGGGSGAFLVLAGVLCVVFGVRQVRQRRDPTGQ